MFKFLKNPQLRRSFIALVAVLILMTALVIVMWPYRHMLADKEAIEQIIDDSGHWGPLIFMTMQIIQVVLAPIPGQVVYFFGGFLFGTFWGTIFSLIGTTLGFALVFVLSRRLGRPFVEYFVSKENLKKFDYISKTKGIWVLLVGFILPVIPDALLGYMAGLTVLKIRTLILISIIGRLPGILLLSLAGGRSADAQYGTVIFIVVGFAVVAVLSYIKRDQLKHFLKQLDKK